MRRLARIPSLAALQKQMQAHLLDGDAAIESQIIGTPRAPAARRLAVYSNAYRSRLAEALAANYPALAKWMGEAAFAELAHAYIRAHPSRRFSIRWYGDALADFLAGEPRYSEAPLIEELARFEWAVGEAFDAADASPVGAAALTAIAPERWAALRLAWHPSVRVLALAWNAPQTWQALVNDRERPVAQVSAEPQGWLVWRHDLTVRFRSLAPAESRVLALARFGSDFGQLCDALCTELGEADAARQAAAWLGEWVAGGLIVAVNVPE